MTEIISSQDLGDRRALKRLQAEFGGGTAEQIRRRILVKLQAECLSLGSMVSRFEDSLVRNGKRCRHLNLVKPATTECTDE